MIMLTTSTILTDTFGQEIDESNVTFEYSHKMPWSIRSVFYSVDKPTDYVAWDISREQVLTCIESGEAVEMSGIELDITEDEFVFCFWTPGTDKSDNHVNVHVNLDMLLNFLNRTLDDVPVGKEQYDWDTDIITLLS